LLVGHPPELCGSWRAGQTLGSAWPYGDDASAGRLGGDQSPWKDRLWCTGNGCPTVRTRQWSKTLKMAVVARVSRAIPCALTSVRYRTRSPRCFGSSPIVAFRLAEARLHHPVRSFRRPSLFALRRARLPGYRLWQLVALFGVRRTSLSAACRRLRPARLGVWGPLAFAIRFGGSFKCASLGRQRCFGSVVALATASAGVHAYGDVEVRGLPRTRASPSWLFLRIATLASRQCLRCGSPASVGSSTTCGRCDGDACCFGCAFVCVRSPTSVGTATVVRGYWLRPVSCRDASCIGSACAVSSTQRESNGRFGDPYAFRRILHIELRLGGGLTNRTLSGVLAPSGRGFGYIRALRRLCVNHVPRDTDSRLHVLRSAHWSDPTL